MAFKKFEPRRDFPPRQKYQGDWACADCGTKITELPFEPSPERPVYCRDCWMKRRAERPQR